MTPAATTFRFACALLAATLSVILPTTSVAAERKLTRSQALQLLSDADAAKRREAVARLGDVGVMADAKVLVAQLRDTDEETRSGAEESLWKIWARSGDKKVDALYEQGIRQMGEGLGQDAVATFSRIITMKPDFAEAWNKRATLYFLMGENEKSLADCDQVMKRNPYHFGALAGYFQIYLQMEDYERALRYGRRALEVNPNMEGVKAGVEAVERMLRRGRQAA
jgi:tetratricopeptide (TPR) repeat protein